MDIKPLPKLDALLTQAPPPIPADDDEEQRASEQLRLRRGAQHGLNPAPSPGLTTFGSQMHMGAQVLAKMINVIASRLLGGVTMEEAAEAQRMHEAELERLRREGLADKRLSDVLKMANPSGDAQARAANAAISRMARHALASGQITPDDLSDYVQQQSRAAHVAIRGAAPTAGLQPATQLQTMFGRIHTMSAGVEAAHVPDVATEQPRARTPGTRP